MCGNLIFCAARMIPVGWLIDVDDAAFLVTAAQAMRDPLVPGPSGDRGVWRQGGKVPHHVYRQRGAEPDRRAFPVGDPPVGMFATLEDAALACAVVNRLAPHPIQCVK